MGLCYVEPSTSNFPSRLRWHKLYNQNIQVGDILASFDLIHETHSQFNLGSMSSSVKDMFDAIKEKWPQCEPIPRAILPKTKLYMLEILFWGLRDLTLGLNLARLSLNRERFIVTIEIGDKAYRSTSIETTRSNDNFKISRLKCEIVSTSFTMKGWSIVFIWIQMNLYRVIV